ncbi:MAG: Mor transcription activator family protein [Thermodesulfobacteriota bacterium]|nr:Mor transcription activator family protein [Thermodesulfobacteriota bacterium]
MAEFQDLVLDGVYAEIASFFGDSGHEIAMTLAQHFGGQNIYFPSLKTISMPGRNQKILKAFKGTNYRELACKFDLTEQRIRDIVGKKGQVRA